MVGTEEEEGQAVLDGLLRLQRPPTTNAALPQLMLVTAAVKADEARRRMRAADASRGRL